MKNTESTGNIAADAVIVGGGVIGLAIGRAMALRGLKNIAIVERGAVGAEASWASAGMLTAQVHVAEDSALLRLSLASRDMFPALADSLREETGISIALDRTGTLMVAFGEREEAHLAAIHSWQTSIGLSAELLSGDAARRLEPNLSPDLRAALRFPNDAQVENRRLVTALADANMRSGATILQNEPVERIETERGRVTGVVTSRRTISSPAVVNSAGAWSSLIASGSAAEISVEPVRGQILCFEAVPRLIRHVIFSERGYLVPRGDGRLIAGSTSEFAGYEKQVTASGIESLARAAAEIAPAISGVPLSDSWAGLRPRSVDELPVLGESAVTRGLFYATGHYRAGILLAPVTGELIAELIQTGKPSPALEPFSPARFSRLTAAAQ